MSLHKFADMVAKQGRGEDSLLIHMTPDEVQRLQAFAEANGRSLTINPETGLPEAGMLSDLFKAVAPIALGAFLGPAGMGLTIGGLSSAATAGLLTGGITTLATGSLSRGLMAGLGAYGGAGLAEGLGTAAVQGEVAANMPTLAGQAPEQIADYAKQVNAVRDTAMSNVKAMPFMDKMSSGIAAAADNPMSFAKQNLGNISAAAAPIMAGAMVPTTTSMPENKNPAYIRQYVAGDRPQAPRALAPVLASEWGARNFSDAYAKPMATGGIVALAAGGAPTMLSDEQLYQKTGSWEAAAAARDEQNRALNIYNDAQRLASAAGSAPQAQVQAAPVNLGQSAADYVRSAATPTTTTEQFVSGAQNAGIGLTQPLATALQNSGLSAAAQYALTHADIGSPLNAEETYGGLKGLSSNINYVASGLQNQIGAGKLTGQSAREQALAEMNRYGINEADILRATGKTIRELFPDTVVKPPVSVIPGGYYGNDTGNALTTTPGDIVSNPDGTVTVVPNIPGRPEGGFTGMGQVKDAYTAGGGSLGYTAKAPRTIDEFNQMFNKQTGDSLAAYNYLMGKGAYPTKSGVGEIMKPYEEAVLGYPTDITRKKYINVNGKMVLNPDYKPPVTKSSGSGTGAGAVDLTKAKTIEVVDSSGYDNQTYTAVLQEDGTYLAGNGKRYDVTGKELAAEGGMMGYAMGGGLGSLGSYSDGGRLLKGPGDGVSDSIPATIGEKRQPARLADGEFVIPARIVSELGNGSTDAGAKKLYAMMDRVQKARGKTTGKNKVAANSRADKYLPA